MINDNFKTKKCLLTWLIVTYLYADWLMGRTGPTPYLRPAPSDRVAVFSSLNRACFVRSFIIKARGIPIATLFVWGSKPWYITLDSARFDVIKVITYT